jgi:hypothetical protein
MTTSYRKFAPALAIVSIAALSLTACGGDKKEAEAPKKSEASSSAPAASTPAAEETTPAAESSSPAAESSSPAAGGSSGTTASGDQAACKSALDVVTNGSSELSSAMSDPSTGVAKIEKLANDIKTQAAKIKDPATKKAVESYAQYFTDIAAAAKKQDVQKIQEIAKQAQDTSSDLYKNAMAMSKCAYGM